MKIKNLITKILILVVSILLVMGTGMSFATDTKSFKLSTNRYIWEDGEYKQKDGYQLTSSGHTIYQILSVENDTTIVYDGTSYYCLNATAGTWAATGEEAVGYDTPREYNKSYNLETDLEQIASDNQGNDVYYNVAAGPNVDEVLWILDNIYIPTKATTEEEEADNLKRKQELLARAGIIYKERTVEGLNGEEQLTYYAYEKTGDYDYASIATVGVNGYYYYDDSEQVDVILPDELVETVQQAAIWYFTNYYNKDGTNTFSSETYNVYDMDVGGWLTVYGNGLLYNYYEAADSNSTKVGAWYQEQASILCHYLIDAAIANAKSEENSETDVVTVNSSSQIEQKTIDNEDYYVVGPIKIEQQKDVTYDLNKILINDEENAQAVISDSTGEEKSDQNLMNYIGSEFYVRIPTSSVSGATVTISFEGTYTTNEKTLWISENATEQPIVAVKPTEVPLKISTTAKINKEFDLALRKAIVSIKDSNGNTKAILNENALEATRKITYEAKGVISTNGTATYNHRKDPVVVENGDIITYSITIYNEGDIDGYATTIVDKLPEGLALAGYSSNGTTTGMYISGNITNTYIVNPITYTYVYNPTDNTITFTNVTTNVLEAYEGDDELSSETIEIECEVVATASTSTNTYLTNIAYISGEYNSDTGEEVTEDRDSFTTKSPSTEQKTTGEKYKRI